jgi:hypothetical protein
MSENAEFSPKQVRGELSRLNFEGVLDISVLESLRLHDGMAALECEVLEYKRELGKSKELLARRIRDIVAFYNTYGGYIVLGVNEDQRNRHFTPIGIAKNIVDTAQLKALIRLYTARQIDITYREFPLRSAVEGNLTLGVIHIPKRGRHQAPATFGKDGPLEGKSAVFAQDSIYFRLQDNSVPATTNEHHWFLASDRTDPALLGAVNTIRNEATKLILDENLPDRNFICPEFVGRKEELLKLWSWLSDEFQFAKVLAGDGGKGKSSIAYRFAEEVCRSKAYELEKIIWLTAKTKQFRGLKDDWDVVPETHYSTFEELLRALCSQLAILQDEIADSSVHHLKQLLKEAFTNIPCLVIVDDVDSLPLEQQKMALETAMQLGNSRARFILTTRKNFTYSSALCVEVGGLQKDEYQQYVTGLCTALGFPNFKLGEIEQFRKASDGSPLFSESLLRLVRNGMRVSDAVRFWSGKAGDKVRKAALESEVKNLSPEGIRTLFAAVLLHECSLTELAQVTGYDLDTLTSCIEELRALFLLSAPAIIAKEARFRVQNNTRLLVLENQTTLVKDPAAIRKAFERVRSGQPAVVKKGNQRLIGAAITQAAAFLREGNAEDAVSTLIAALKVQPEHPDLLYTLARAEKAKATPDLTKVRQLLKRAYDFGQRKAAFFDVWYFAELNANHPIGAVEVASYAIDERIPDKRGWHARRGNAKYLAGRMRESFDLEGATDDLMGSRDDLREALKDGENTDYFVLLEKLQALYEDLWSLVQRKPSSIPRAIAEFDLAMGAMEDIEDSVEWANRGLVSLRRMQQGLMQDGTLSERQYNLVDQRLTLLTAVLVKSQKDSYYFRGRWNALVRDAAEFKTRLDLAPRKELASIQQSKEKAKAPAKDSVARRFDVFLAHNSSDKSFVRLIANRLQERGLKPWLDENEIPPGRWFQDVIQDAIYNARTAAIFIGPHGLGRWQALELRSFISQAIEHGIPTIPVLLPHVNEIPNELRFLRELNAVWFKTAEDESAMTKLVWGIRGQDEK